MIKDDLKYSGHTTAVGKVIYNNASTEYIPNITYVPDDYIFYRGEKYRIDEVTTCGNSIGDGEIRIRGYKVNEYYGFSGTATIDDPMFIKKFREAFNPYSIKKVICNPAKNATTVIFKNGSVEVVKRSPDDPEADIFSVVAYAVAKHIYGSNSAFKREVCKDLDFIDKEFEKIVKHISSEDLAESLKLIAKNLKKKIEEKK